MKRTLIELGLVLGVATIAFVAILRAQTSSQFSASYASGPLSNCPAPATGAIIDCAVTGIGMEESVNGAAYVPLIQPPVTVSGTVTSVNGKKPDSTGNVTLSATTTLN